MRRRGRFKLSGYSFVRLTIDEKQLLCSTKILNTWGANALDRSDVVQIE